MESAPTPLKRDPLEALRAAFGTGDLRRLQFGWAASSVGSWAFMVVLAVYAYDVGGALFAPLPLAAVENLAARLVPVAVTPGQEVIRQGDIGDRFYVIADGHVAVECDGEPRRTEGPGDFFGEIALLRDTPRTATVHATEPGLLYALEREHFVGGVTGNPRSVLAADGIIETRLGAVGYEPLPDA